MSDQPKDIRQTCSVNGKLCINGIREDFEKDPLTKQPRPCHKWVYIANGTDPQTGKPIDGTWCCNEWANLKIRLEQSQMTRNVQAAVNDLGNMFLAALPPESRKQVLDNSAAARKTIEERQNGSGPKE